MLFAATLASLLAAASASPGGSGTCWADTTAIAAASAMGANTPSLGIFASVPTGAMYTAGTAVPVTITGTGTFEGILLYAIAGPATGDSATTSHVGTWIGFNSTYQTLDSTVTAPVANCTKLGTHATLSHTSPIEKTLPVTFNWLPPPNAVGNVSVVAVVVIGQTAAGAHAFQVAQTSFGPSSSPNAVAAATTSPTPSSAASRNTHGAALSATWVAAVAGLASVSALAAFL
ncbi:hypothetical protein BDK51DRAFT_25828 [Blyttiomyces helicus]|uniref:Uncharacterized protein n=1 Tax=Blyttiomyces helicus TaxID=388810 RepID=A0A4P9WHK5_9FUNG|nr:hypothetical protein BDK51DRAFT_25828 [Blyttiomyces helicus]|eukprot:RKO91872.1 hypothetical protein BDK51DRAFT_25828 [Blyttiomyces helicus]